MSTVSGMYLINLNLIKGFIIPVMSYEQMRGYNHKLKISLFSPMHITSRKDKPSQFKPIMLKT